MKSSEVNNKHKNKDGNLKTIWSIWYFKRKIFPDGRLLNYKARLCAHGGMKQCGVKYWETNDTLENKIIVRSILSISSIPNFPSISIDYLPSFTQANLDVDFFMATTLGMGVDRNRG